MHAHPLDTNLFEWHFTLRGPPSPSPYATGAYHGRIVLPPQYPLRPPSFRFLTPTGRFEVNREICLSISGHHEETWQPAWGIRTAMVALRAFMDTDAKGQLGGLDTDDATRRRLARDSNAWRCPTGCSGTATNADILRQREEEAEAAGRGRGVTLRDDDKVPEGLRLAYREDLAAGQRKRGEERGAAAQETAEKDAAPAASQAPSPPPPPPPPLQPATAVKMVRQDARANAQQQAVAIATPGSPAPALRQQQQRRQAARQTQQQGQLRQPGMGVTAARVSADGAPAWVDQAIYAVIFLLAVLLLRKVV